MNTIIPLGKLEKVALKVAWPSEDDNFTPWLATPEAIALLGNALNMELEIEAVEQKVGVFRADILARMVDEEEHRVIIENQYGQTDHIHLGQILTYLAGVENSKTFIWIAETIRADHRAAIDWLNTNTTEEFSFFAIEIELWRIGSSPPAPRFNVIASPNDWTRSVRKAARQVGEKELAERHHIRMAYWASFSEYLKKEKSAFRVKPTSISNWEWFSVGRAGFGITATISILKKRAGIGIYISNDVGKAAFRALHAQKDAIERELGEALDWQELPGKKASRILIYKNDFDPLDQSEFAEMHSWMLTRMDRFRKIFGARIKSLPENIGDDTDEMEEPQEHAAE